MYILGINAYHGDAAAAIIKDGELLAAVEEERFNRVKHCAGFPAESVRYCLQAAGIEIQDVDHVGISRDPSAHLHKKVLFAARRIGRSGVERQMTRGRMREEVGSTQTSVAVETDETQETGNGKTGEQGNGGNGTGTSGILNQIRDRLNNAARVRDVKDDLAQALGVAEDQLRAQFHNIEHHRAHLASSFYVSPFERAALLSIDGFGDFISTMWGVGDGNTITVMDQVEYPHSTGIVYTATTQFLGFPHYGDEGKVMGLAPYGVPRYIDGFRDIIRTEKRGQFRLNLDYFRHHAEGVDMTWDEGSPRIGRIFSDKFARTFGPARAPDSALTDRDRDIAASLQLRLEEVAFHILNYLHDQTGLTDLALSGGVAYNSVMNGKILLNTPFRRMFIQPAAGDSGTALGVCYEICNQVTESGVAGVTQSVRLRSDVSGTLQDHGIKSTQTNSLRYVMRGAYTGPEFSNDEIRAQLEQSGLDFESYSDDEVTKRAAQDIADGLVVGWFQGRMEFGPRALGNRSIVVDPRRSEMKEILNQRIKKRETFRPFAPSILEERTADYFEQSHPAPTMLMVYQIRAERRAEIPAVTHVDGSGRLQTVAREDNPRYYQLISDFEKLTGVPVLLNTSFNENEPIVCTPRQAINCFLRTKMDVLYLGNHAVRVKGEKREIDAPNKPSEF
ncbi:MAG TPA: carbamoyltransferase C-terminal domain-containing protein [Pyrinomonadaceae bacterium]|nr:carbamoyltransferase C-terminal domain-containing protein [Pyrinomonadaceae bacterium]